MVTMSKRRWTYVITAIAGAVIVILAVILMQQPIPTSTAPQQKTPPSVSTGAATGVGQTAATLNGNLGGMGTAATVSVGFLYSTDAGLAGATNVTAGSLTAAASFDESLTGLTAGTTYYFKAWANGDGFSAGTVLSFATTSVSPQVRAPSVATNDASSIGQTSATLNGNLQSLGTASSVTVGFLYSTDAGLAGATNVTAGSETAAGLFDQPATGLGANTTYYVKAWALGNGFASGSVVSFTTAKAPSGPGGNGNIVPPGWSHAACPDLPDQAKAYGVRARCEFNMTYGEMKKEGLTFLSQQAALQAALQSLKPNAALHANDNSAFLRVSDPGNSGDHRSDNARQF